MKQIPEEVGLILAEARLGHLEEGFIDILQSTDFRGDGLAASADILSGVYSALSTLIASTSLSVGGILTLNPILIALAIISAVKLGHGVHKIVKGVKEIIISMRAKTLTDEAQNAIKGIVATSDKILSRLPPEAQERAKEAVQELETAIRLKRQRRILAAKENLKSIIQTYYNKPSVQPA